MVLPFQVVWGNRWLICCPLLLCFKFKIKSKTVGVARQQLHFLCSDKAHWFNTRAGSKRKLLLAEGYVLHGPAATSIQVVPADKKSTLPSQDPRLFRASPFIENCIGCVVFTLFSCKYHRKVRSFDTGPDPHHRWLLKSQKSGKGDALRKEQGVFAYFCRRMDKSKASGGTRPAGFVLVAGLESQDLPSGSWLIA